MQVVPKGRLGETSELLASFFRGGAKSGDDVVSGEVFGARSSVEVGVRSVSMSTVASGLTVGVTSTEDRKSVV